MLDRISRHIRANVVGYLALFVALSGTALASGVLNKKKVNKIISNRAPGLTVGNANALGGLPASGLTVGNANALGGTPASGFVHGPPEGLREVGTSGNPGFGSCATGHNWQDAASLFQKAAFYRDPLGVVHLTGSVNCSVVPNLTTLFTLPAGYTPGAYIMFPSTDNNGANLNIAVDSSGNVIAGSVGLSAGSQVSVDGISFRCGSSGVNGCP